MKKIRSLLKPARRIWQSRSLPEPEAVYLQGRAALPQQRSQKSYFSSGRSGVMASSSDSSLKLAYPKNFFLAPDIITAAEEAELMTSLDKILSKRKYESNHWDSVIAQYKEVEVTKQLMTPLLLKVSTRCKEFVCNALNRQIMDQFLPIHLIDLAQAGFISPHVDSVKFSGDFIAGLSLMSPRIMRLSPAKYHSEFTGSAALPHNSSSSSNNNGDEANSDNIKEESFEFVMPRRSLYVIQGPLRYDFAHEVLGKDQKALWQDNELLVPVSSVDRRLSLMFRNMHPCDLKAVGMK